MRLKSQLAMLPLQQSLTDLASWHMCQKPFGSQRPSRAQGCSRWDCRRLMLRTRETLFPRAHDMNRIRQLHMRGQPTALMHVVILLLRRVRPHRREQASKYVLSWAFMGTSFAFEIVAYFSHTGNHRGLSDP